MKYIVGVELDNENKLKYYIIEKDKIKKNITVVVEDENGINFGRIITDIHPINMEKLNKKLGKIIRIATKKDYQNYQKNKKLGLEALQKCRQLTKKYNLDMNILDANFTLDRDQLLFHFYSENRIDFRNLAKDLAFLYKTRIELRQIGVRDKAKKIGGIGLCGQQLCCARYLDSFDSVSISMAKNQNLSLNPTKINGICGRLLCCLKYEDEPYKEYKKNLPSVGQIVEIKEGKGKVLSVNILKKTFKVELENKGIIEVDYGSN